MKRVLISGGPDLQFTTKAPLRIYKRRFLDIPIVVPGLYVTSYEPVATLDLDTTSLPKDLQDRIKQYIGVKTSDGILVYLREFFRKLPMNIEDIKNALRNTTPIRVPRGYLLYVSKGYF